MAEAFYLHGFKGESLEGTPYVEILTPVALTGDQVREALGTVDPANIDPDQRLYKLVDVGALADGLDVLA